MVSLDCRVYATDEVWINACERPKKGLLIFAGILVGCVVYALIMALFDKFMFHAFRCESLGAYDAAFLLDDQKNLANVIGVIFFETCEFESMKSYLLGKIKNIHKCHSKLVKVLGMWYYKEMAEEEWKVKREAIVQLKTNIHTGEELNQYLCSE